MRPALPWKEESQASQAAIKKEIKTKPSHCMTLTQLEARMNLSLVKSLSALLPLAMSLAALALVVGHALMFGIVHEADEGTPAHIFQLLMAAQAPIIAFFALKWLPRAPGQTLRVLALQTVAALAAFAAVYFLT